jgi:formylglycine-generating enzyme required for sulfatase activity
VWEWVFDNYDGEYYKSGPKNNPKGPLDGFFSVLRGGSWKGTQMDVRSAARGRCIPMDWFQQEGFRLVLSPN